MEEAEDGGGIPDHWGIMGFAVQQQFQCKSHLEVKTARFYRQYSVCCYAFLFCDGVIRTWLARCLGPSRLVRREEVGLTPRNLEVDREGEKKCAWCTGPAGPDEEGKGD